ncbi:StAR-related lipid transfer protein 13 [Eufriesea mexicana]|uniref:StAR-related lipid transfer protein 13 n=1 Tax=Eufriesea mexicana TaxID=516756 RepID=A0A310SMH9_9HYME|nr:StAR-related lipid transfer protein 13 [Eufriesea mexicana]
MDRLDRSVVPSRDHRSRDLVQKIWVDVAQVAMEAIRSFNARHPRARIHGARNGNKRGQRRMAAAKTAKNNVTCACAAELHEISDYQFPIDVSGVAKDHPFLEADSLQSLFRRLHALNRCANMKIDTHHTHSTSHSKSKSLVARFQVDPLKALAGRSSKGEDLERRKYQPRSGISGQSLDPAATRVPLYLNAS